MFRCHGLMLPFAATLGLSVGSAGLAQDPSPRSSPALAAPAAAAALSAPRTPSPAPFAPGLDDLMTMLVQPRHIKLYYAGTSGNWELAAAEARDLRAALKRIATTLSSYQGNDLDAAITSIIAPKIEAVDRAIATADSNRFSTSYADLTNACNACHTYLEHPYHVIKIPTEDSKGLYPDQDFTPAP